MCVCVDGTVRRYEDHISSTIQRQMRTVWVVVAGNPDKINQALQIPEPLRYGTTRSIEVFISEENWWNLFLCVSCPPFFLAAPCAVRSHFFAPPLIDSIVAPTLLAPLHLPCSSSASSIKHHHRSGTGQCWPQNTVTYTQRLPAEREDLWRIAEFAAFLRAVKVSSARPDIHIPGRVCVCVCDS